MSQQSFIEKIYHDASGDLCGYRDPATREFCYNYRDSSWCYLDSPCEFCIEHCPLDSCNHESAQPWAGKHIYHHTVGSSFIIGVGYHKNRIFVFIRKDDEVKVYSYAPFTFREYMLFKLAAAPGKHYTDFIKGKDGFRDSATGKKKVTCAKLRG